MAGLLFRGPASIDAFHLIWVLWMKLADHVALAILVALKPLTAVIIVDRGLSSARTALATNNIIAAEIGMM